MSALSRGRTQNSWALDTWVSSEATGEHWPEATSRAVCWIHWSPRNNLVPTLCSLKNFRLNYFFPTSAYFKILLLWWPWGKRIPTTIYFDGKKNRQKELFDLKTWVPVNSSNHAPSLQYREGRLQGRAFLVKISERKLSHTYFCLFSDFTSHTRVYLVPTSGSPDNRTTQNCFLLSKNFQSRTAKFSEGEQVWDFCDHFGERSRVPLFHLSNSHLFYPETAEVTGTAQDKMYRLP